MDDTFRKRLRQLRLESGKTQDDMSKLLHINRSTYSEYERGKIMPPVDKIEQIAWIFGVKPHYIIGWDTPSAEENKSQSALAEKIKNLRHERHKTLSEISEEIGIKTDILLQYEKGIMKIPYTAVKKIADYFSVDTSLLYGMEFDSELDENEALKESLQRSKMAEIWNREIGKELFNEEELDELINYARYIISKKKK